MATMIEIIYALAATNLIFIALAVHFFRKSKITQSRPETIELQEFLMDLMSGGGLVHVKRIAPTDIVIRARTK